MNRRRQRTASAKIVWPRADRLVPRPRLHARIHAGLDTGLVWIEGPAGAGKTSVVVTSLAERGPPALWLQLDAGDADPAVFFHFLNESMVLATPRSRTRLPVMTPDFGGDAEAFARRLARAMARRSPEPRTVVLDGYESVTAGDAVDRAVAALLDHLPVGWAFICASRAAPPAAFSRRAVSSRLARIEPEALALDGSEARAIAAALLPQPLPEPAVARFVDRTGGWPAGFVLLLRWAATNPDASTDAAFLDEHVYDYFSTQVFAAFRDAEQEFLLVASLFEDVLPDLVARLAPVDGAAAFLRRMVSGGLFTTWHGEVFRFHALFRDYLRARLRRSRDAAALRQLESAAARALCADGLWAAALPLLVEGEHWQAAAEAIEAVAPEWLATGRHARLRDALARLPAALVDAGARLRVLRAEATAAVDARAAHDDLRAVFEARGEPGDTVARYTAWAGMVETASILRDYERLYELGAALPQVREACGGGLPAMLEVRLTIAATMVVVSTTVAADVADFWLDRGRAVLGAGIPPHIRALLAGHLLQNCTWRDGNRVDAELFSRHASLTPAQQEVTPPSYLWSRLWRLNHAFWIDPKASTASVRREIDATAAIAREFGLEELAAIVPHVRVYSHLFFGRSDVDAATLDRLEHDATLAATAHDRAHARFLLAWHALLARDLDRARQYAESANEESRVQRAVVPRAYGYFGCAQVAISRGDFREALRHVAAFRRHGARRPTIELQATYALARIALRKGLAARARRLARHFFTSGMRLGVVRLVFAELDDLARLCAMATEDGVATDHVRAMVGTLGLHPPPLAGAESWPWPVRVRALGRFELEVGGAPVRFRRKTPQRPLQLLEMLVAVGPQGAPGHLVADRLWPDGAGDDARNSLTTNLHRLRRITGVDALIVGQGRIALDRSRVWVDAWYFEALARTFGSDGTPPGDEEARRALQLYRGRLLEHRDEPWVETARERIRRCYVELAAALARRLQEGGSSAPARRLLEEAIDAEPTAETLHRGLLDALAALGEVAEARRAFARCRAMLRETYATEPSPATVTAFERATHHA